MNTYTDVLKKEGIGILPTDTLYGLVGLALSPTAVGRIYTLKGRNIDKPFIVLIAKKDDLALFTITLSAREEEFLSRFWPGKVSIILPCRNDTFTYLHRGIKTLAFRVPDDATLVSTLEKVGPLVAPSANPQGLPPARTVEEAKKYFGTSVEFYEDGGIRDSLPSTLVEIKDGRYRVLREGAVDLSIDEKIWHGVR